MKYLIFILIPFISVTGFAQKRLTGAVLTEDNQVLAGAMVRDSISGNVAYSNSFGRFSIEVGTLPGFLAITHAGFDKTIVPYRDTSGILARLQKTTNNRLDEVVVVAYGTTTRRFNVGSVSGITAGDIASQPVSNLLAALQGRVPGLTVTANSGLPGSSFQLQIRGQNTLKTTPSANVLLPIDNPLFIIDGVPFAPQNGNINQFSSIASPGLNATLNNNYGGMSPFNSIDPNTIESIEVLRDADATSIYGSRGSNGVILITTKKGNPGRTSFQVNAYSGISRVGHTLPMMNTQQYLRMREEAFANDGVAPNTTIYDPGYAPDLLLFDTTRYTDWKKYFLGNSAHFTDITTSLSGGDQRTQFLLHGGFHKEGYVYPGDFGDSRASFGSNLNHTSANRKFNVLFSVDYSYEKNRSSGAPSLLSAYTLEPDYPLLLDNNGNLVWEYNGVPLDGAYAGVNPLAYLKQPYSLENYSLNGHLQASYNLLAGLTVRSSFGYSQYNSREYAGNPASAQNPANTPVATASFGNNDYYSWIMEPQLEYKRNIWKGRLNVLVGGTVQQVDNKSKQLFGSGYTNDALIYAVSTAPTVTATDNYSLYKYMGVFGRVNYILLDKYIFNFTGRRDGSSRFGPGKQFGNFGSAALGWIFSQTNFIKNHLPAISFGKLRASIGTTGSDAIANYQYVQRWAASGTNYQGTLGFTPANLYNPDLHWALTAKKEIGVDLGFWKDRISLSAAWYSNTSSNQLVTYKLPYQTGFSSVLENWNAKIQNKGFELQLDVKILQSKNISWTSSLNLTIPKNKLLRFDGLSQSSYSTTYILGKSVNSVLGFRYIGVNDTTGLFQFRGADGNPTYTPLLPSGGNMNDYAYLGTLDPKYYGGMLHTFSYKNVSFSILLEFKKQMGVNYLSQIYASPLPGWEGNLPQTLESRWRTEGQHSDFQKLTSQYGEAATIARNAFIYSSGVYSDASYIRLKTVSLSYSLPSRWLSKGNNWKVFINAQNLLTITGYKGNDPETQSFYGMPPLRTIVFGAQLNF